MGERCVGGGVHGRCVGEGCMVEGVRCVGGVRGAE